MLCHAGECQCLGSPSSTSDVNKDLTFPILNVNGSLSLGSIHVGLGWADGERTLEVMTVLRNKFDFGPPGDKPALRIGAIPAHHFNPNMCPVDDIFNVNINPAKNIAGITVYKQLVASHLLPDCSDPAEQNSPPRMLALFASVFVRPMVRVGLVMESIAAGSWQFYG